MIELRVLGLKKLRNVLGDKNISFSKFGGYELFFNKKKIEDGPVSLKINGENEVEVSSRTKINIFFYPFKPFKPN